MLSRSSLARSLLVLGMCAAAPLHAQEKEADDIIRMMHAATDALRRGDPAEARNLLERVVTAAPNLSDGHLGLGLLELRQNQPAEAIRELERAIELNSKLPGAHLYLGIAQYQTGQVDGALASLQAETLLEPQHSEAFLWKGMIELNRNRPEQALDALERAKALDPKNPQVLYYSGRAHMLVAEADYGRLRDLDPDSALVHRAMAENFEANAQPEKAIVEYEAAVAKEPGNPDLYEALGTANLSVARREAAQQAFEQAFKLNPTSAIALYNLGRLDVETGKPQEGVALLRRADALHASIAPTAFYLGFGLAQLGQDQEAAASLERSLANQPSPFIAQSAYYQLARVYQRLGRKQDAQKALAELAKLKVDSAAIRQADGQVPDSPSSAADGPLHPGQ